jgi:hypothetical protein
VNRFNLGTTESDLHRAAYAGGLDFRHRFGGASSGDYQIYGALFTSDVRGSAQSIAETQRSSVHYFQRPDADHIDYDTLKTSLTGYGARLQIDRPVGRIRYGNAFYTRTPGFEVNDIGIQKVADWSENFTWLGTVQTQPNSVFNNWSMFTNTWSWWTYGGERTFTQFNIQAAGELRNFWGSSLQVGRRLPAHTLRLRGGPLLNEDGRWVAFGSFYSPQQNSLRVNASYSFARGDNRGTRSASFSPTIAWQPLTSLTATLGPSVTKEKDDIFYVAQAGADASPTYVLGALNRTTTALTTRVDLAFSPSLTLQLYAQPFLSAGAYSDFKEVIAPRAAKYADRFHGFVPQLNGKTYSADTNGDGVTDFTFDDPAFNVKDFRSNTVLRWEYRPGSTIFFVWSQGRHSDGGNELFRTAPQNDFLVKVNRWMAF